ncbi:MAG TPA: dUTP diphosphatase [Candidatus Woesebacteria bacterium]|nr:dUTP diphosphatase [Candidatus Woesebacteria bacterium]
MKLLIKRFDKNLPLPEYKTAGAACVDLYSRLDTTIQPHQVGLIPLNIALQIPKDCWVMIAARGSTHKLGILPVHGIGIGDWDYCGDNDEYLFPALNFTDHEITIEKGTRIGQMMVSKFEKIELEEVDQLDSANRGGFGSTGLK